MAGAANRKAAEQPRRAALYKAKRTKSAARLAYLAPAEPNARSTVLTVAEDALADIDFGQLRDEARQSLAKEA